MTTDRSLLVVTCSMPKDLKIFSVLAQSIDDCVGADVRHRVIVPGNSLSLFKSFETAQREIVAQEDILPFRAYKLPTALRHLEAIASGFRRPMYLAPGPRIIRGWILQQILKIEMTRRAQEDAVMHVDSDVFLIREMGAQDAFSGDNPRFFRAEGETNNPMHKTWIAAAATVFGTAIPDKHQVHYVENCVVWSPQVVRNMIAAIEKNHGKPWYKVLMKLHSFSEYYLYGFFVDMLCSDVPLTPVSSSICHSMWNISDATQDNIRQCVENTPGDHFAMAVQSTSDLSVEQRRDMYLAARDAKRKRL